MPVMKNRPIYRKQLVSRGSSSPIRFRVNRAYPLCQRLSTTFARPKTPMAIPATRFIQRMPP